MSCYKYISSDDRVVSTNNLTEQVIHRSSSGGSFPPSTTKRSYYIEAYSGSANHVYDVTVGRTSDLALATAASGASYLTADLRTDLSRSAANYNQLAKILLGNDSNGNIQLFNRDVDDDPTTNTLKYTYFVNFNRGFTKDKIKPGTFSMEVLLSGTANTAEANKVSVVLSDVSGTTGPTKRLCQTGEYGVLYAVPATGTTKLTTMTAGGNETLAPQGLLFYEAGVAVVSPTIFSYYDASFNNPLSSSTFLSGNAAGLLSLTPKNPQLSGSYPLGTQATSSIADIFVSRSLGEISETLSTRILTASYQATTELNSTIYFCRAFNSEFNYSSNPTYLSASEIKVKGGDPLAQPVSYITSVGLYDDKNQLLAVAKLSEPIKKTPETELIARVRLDF
jgi:hypothetical protein